MTSQMVAKSLLFARCSGDDSSERLGKKLDYESPRNYSATGPQRTRSKTIAKPQVTNPECFRPFVALGSVSGTLSRPRLTVRLGASPHRGVKTKEQHNSDKC